MITTRTQIRQMIRRDLQECLSIERRAFEFPWSEEEFIRNLQERNVIAMILEVEDEVKGYMAYQLKKTRLDLLNFAIDPDDHRRGYGTQLLLKLKYKLSPDRRTCIRTFIRESNLTAQLFFKSQDFRWVKTIDDVYVDSPESAYQMEFGLDVKS